MTDFAQSLRRWRRARRMSQLDLSAEAEVSSRHIAFLETGRARPSRAMVLRLAEVLEVPRAERNGLLNAAGFAPHYPDLGLDADEMTRVRAAMDWTIRRHAPYPAVVMDRLWRLVALNAPARRLFGGFGLTEGASLLDTMASPLAAQAIENWGEVGHHTLRRLRAESARAGGIAEIDAAAAAMAQDPAIAAFVPPERPVAVVPTIYRAGDLRLSLFSTYAQFGAAEDAGLADLKIELMFPADAESEAVLRGMDDCA
jgi:transcriptional regulator with XRE-family HTH domain